MRVQRLSSSLSPSEMKELEEKIASLERDEEKAKTLFQINGIQFDIITPRRLGTPIPVDDSNSSSTPARAEAFTLFLAFVSLISLLSIFAVLAVDPISTEVGMYTPPNYADEYV